MSSSALHDLRTAIIAVRSHTSCYGLPVTSQELRWLLAPREQPPGTQAASSRRAGLQADSGAAAPRLLILLAEDARDIGELLLAVVARRAPLAFEFSEKSRSAARLPFC